MPDGDRFRRVRRAAVPVLLLFLVALAAPRLARHDPTEQRDAAAARKRPPGTMLHAVHLADGRWRLADRVERTPEGLEIQRLGRIETVPADRVTNLTADGVDERVVFLLGTDGLGRDVLARIVYGARVSLSVGLLAMAMALTLGALVGAVAALGGPWMDGLLMRSVDAFLAFPALFLLLTLTALFEPGTWLLVLVLGVTSWMGVSRLVRSEVLGLARRDFVTAARATGQHPGLVFWRHLLPNAWGPILVQATLLVADMILIESALSYLGFGVQPPTPSWGNMIYEGRAFFPDAWWLSVLPGGAIAVTVVSFNLLADRLRDALDPRVP